MDFRIRTLFFVVIPGLPFPELGSASVIFNPGEKAKNVAPVEEEKVVGSAFGSWRDGGGEIFAGGVRTAPYGKYTARAQFDIGLAREKQGANDAAIEAYQAVVTKFPKEPVAADAQYQIGYIWFTAAQLGAKDAAAATNAETAFEDFLLRD